MIFSQTPIYLLKQIYPNAQFHLNHPSYIALTFDDGPIPEVTEYVIDVLKHYNIPATFFCVGENIQKHTGIFHKLLQNKHSIGNHTFSHLNAWKYTSEEYLQDVLKFYKIYNTPLFRPPYGKLKPSQYKALLKHNFKIVFWSVISYDYHPQMTVQKCLNIIKNKTTGGQIILFHDSQKSFRLISEILPSYIEFCQKLKLTFVPLK
jgi:peptidoglycan/xylan/chitin deacetylase (PgdA/CDA1 family)